jgi:two-component system chemotaxis response regulator CheY
MPGANGLDQKVLVVDEVMAMRKLIRNVLKEIGFSQISEADNGAAALSLLQSERIALVLTDWNLPAMTGLELLRRIRRDPASRDIPVLMVTAEGNIENVVEAIKAGADNFVVKPFTAETIRAKIGQVFKKRAQKPNHKESSGIAA